MTTPRAANDEKNLPQNPAEIPPTKKTGLLSRFGAAAKKGGKKLLHGAQWLRFGSNEKRLEEVLARAEKIPETKKMLDIAKQNNIELRVEGWHPLLSYGGYVGREENAQLPHIGIVNDGDPVGMLTSLHHELRHILQVLDQGILHDNKFDAELRGSQNYMRMMVDEADAFTAEVLQACRLKAQGQSEYFYRLFARGGEATDAVRQLLHKQPYELFHDDEKFARTVFTHILLEGLNAYASLYLREMAEDLKKTKTREEFLAEVQDATPPPPYNTFGDKLSEQYGLKFGRQVCATGLSTVFLHTRPDIEQAVMKSVDRLVKKAPQMTTENFLKARDEILKKIDTAQYKMPRHDGGGKDLDGQDPYSEKTHALRQTLRIASQGDKPMLRDSFRKAAQDYRAAPSKPDRAEAPKRTSWTIFARKSVP